MDARILPAQSGTARIAPVGVVDYDAVRCIAAAKERTYKGAQGRWPAIAAGFHKELGRAGMARQAEIEFWEWACRAEGMPIRMARRDD